LHACGYYVPSPSDETECNSCLFTTLDRNRSATNMFRSFDISAARISLCFGSITTQSHINSEPAFIAISSFYIQEYSLIFEVCTFVSNSRQIHDLFLSYIKKDNALTVFLKDKPKKYKCNP
jgi:hypothetical protein